MTTGDVFFYADEDSAHYDELHLLTDPDYERMHAALWDQISYFLRANDADNSAQPLILDLGCGTGIQGINLLSVNKDVKLAAVDISQTMLTVFRDKVERLHGRAYSKAQCRYLKADLLCAGWAKRCLETWGLLDDSFSVVMTVYVFHHFSSSDKLALYKEVYESLSAGGVFFNADLFSYDSNWLSEMAQGRVESWIAEQFNAARNDPSGFSIKDPDEWERLRNDWIKHVRQDNQPIPAISSGKPASTSDQQLLFEAGFEFVECTFRSGQAGILCAQKPKS